MSRCLGRLGGRDVIKCPLNVLVETDVQAATSFLSSKTRVDQHTPRSILALVQGES